MGNYKDIHESLFLLIHILHIPSFSKLHCTVIIYQEMVSWFKPIWNPLNQGVTIRLSARLAKWFTHWVNCFFMDRWPYTVRAARFITGDMVLQLRCIIVQFKIKVLLFRFYIQEVNASWSYFSEDFFDIISCFILEGLIIVFDRQYTYHAPTRVHVKNATVATLND